jgi:acetyltransferase-like isoleucine patch superfamily enzyme
MMKAFIAEGQTKVAPFGDAPGDCLIGNQPLKRLQNETLHALGLEPVPSPTDSDSADPGEHLVLADSLFFTRELLCEFLKKSRELGIPTVCCLKKGLITLVTIVPTQDVQSRDEYVEYPLYYVPAGRPTDQPRAVVIDADRWSDIVRFPEHMLPGGGYRVPLSDMFVIQIGHWTNLWAANAAFLLAGLARLKKNRLRILMAALRARSTNQNKLLGQANTFGRRCDIHPTAYIEGSIIGDNVKVAAGALIRESLIGSDSYIANGVIVDFSVVGEGSTLFNGCVVQHSTLYPGACVSSRYVGLNLAGRNVFISDGVTVADFRFDGKHVHVLKGGESVDTEVLLLGTCLGHDVYLGAGCILAPGRSVPNGWRIIPERGRLVESFHGDGEVVGHRVLKRPGTQPDR